MWTRPPTSGLAAFRRWAWRMTTPQVVGRIGPTRGGHGRLVEDRHGIRFVTPREGRTVAVAWLTPERTGPVDGEAPVERDVPRVTGVEGGDDDAGTRPKGDG